MFVEDDEQRAALKEAFEPVAKASKGKISFVYIDATKFGSHGKSLNLKETWPAFAISEPESQLKFPFDQSKEITAENIKAFVDSYLAGEIEPSLKSEKAPADNSGPVKVIVGTNFEEIVLDKTKDVFLEIYARMCHFLIEFYPVYHHTYS